MEMIYFVIPENTIIYVIIAVVFIYLRKIISPPPTPIQNQILTTIDQRLQKLERDILSLQNDNARIQNESEWRNEARSIGL